MKSNLIHLFSILHSYSFSTQQEDVVDCIKSFDHSDDELACMQFAREDLLSSEKRITNRSFSNDIKKPNSQNKPLLSKMPFNETNANKKTTRNLGLRTTSTPNIRFSTQSQMISLKNSQNSSEKDQQNQSKNDSQLNSFQEEEENDKKSQNLNGGNDSQSQKSSTSRNSKKEKNNNQQDKN